MLMALITLLAATLWIGIAAFGVLYVCFIVVMVGRREYEDKTNPRIVRLLWAAAAILFVVPGYPLDIAFNWTYGLALGVTWNLTLSGKLEHIRETQPYGWRRDVADYICLIMLDPYDAAHC